MKFIDRLRKDKQFRLMVVAIGMVIIIMWASSEDEKKTTSKPFTDPTCDRSLTFVGGCVRDDCVVQRRPTDLNDWNPVSILFWTAEGSKICKGCVAEGYFTKENDYDSNPGRYPNDVCCTGKYKKIDDVSGEPGNQEGIRCLPAGAEGQGVLDAFDTQCNPAEAQLARIAQGMGLFEGDCKTAYFTTIFGGGFLALVLLAAAL